MNMTEHGIARAAPRLLGFLPTWRECALFAAIAAVLLWAAWGWIDVASTELGDFAANSLLVLQAKSGVLLRGNYSRVGFNHPGPAILYVLVLGEVLFHDLLPLARSPFSGQLMAVMLYNAFWLVVACNLVRRFAGSASATLLAGAIFILVLATLKFEILTGIWFPDLYCMPFLVMLLASARLVLGRTDSILALAVSCGFLVNGHAAFAAVLTIIMLAALLANYRMGRRDPHLPRVASAAFVRAERAALSKFGAIALLFMLPLLILTVTEFPGPLYQYASFGSNRKPNTMLQALHYVGVYWCGLAPMLGGLAATVALWFAVGRRPGTLADSVRALLAVLWGATVALLLYARFGIDMLDQVYIGEFYYVVPALALALASLVLFDALRWRRKAWAVLPLAALALMQAARVLPQASEATWSYHQQGVAPLYRALAAVPRQGRLVLDLNTDADWGDVWAGVLGVQAYAKRQGNDLLCINRNWHISFTRQGECTAADLASGKRYLVRKASALAPGGPAPVAQGMGLALVELVPPQVVGAGWLTLAAQQPLFKDFMLEAGWSQAEAEHVWAERKTGATLALPVAPGFSGTVTLDLAAFLPRPDATQSATLLLDGRPVSTVAFSARDNRKQIQVPVTRAPAHVLHLTLRVAHVYSPAEVGSPDRRKLGVALYAVKIEEQQ